MAVDNVGADVCVKFGVCRSNDFRDIRRADLVSNERTNEQDKAYPNSAKGVWPKNVWLSRQQMTHANRPFQNLKPFEIF